MHGRGIISGTTTAATIWVTAAIGLLAGAGYAGGALGASILVRLVLTGVSLYEIRVAGKEPEVVVAIDFVPMKGITMVRLKRILADYHVAMVAAEWKTGEDLHRLTLRLHLPRQHLRELLDDLVSLPEIRGIQENKS